MKHETTHVLPHELVKIALAEWLQTHYHKTPITITLLEFSPNAVTCTVEVISKGEPIPLDVDPQRPGPSEDDESPGAVKAANSFVLLEGEDITTKE